MSARKLAVAADELRQGDVLTKNGATIERAWIATNSRFVMIEFAEGGIRTAYRFSKFEIERP